MGVHRESQQFKIFADGFADIFGIDALTGLVKEMVQRPGARPGPDATEMPPCIGFQCCWKMTATVRIPTITVVPDDDWLTPIRHRHLLVSWWRRSSLRRP